MVDFNFICPACEIKDAITEHCPERRLTQLGKAIGSGSDFQSERSYMFRQRRSWVDHGRERVTRNYPFRYGPRGGWWPRERRAVSRATLIATPTPRIVNPI
jgi:hypothetical protein